MEKYAEISEKLLYYVNTLRKEYDNISITVKKDEVVLTLIEGMDTREQRKMKPPSRRGAAARMRRKDKRANERKSSGYSSISSGEEYTTSVGEPPPPSPPQPPQVRTQDPDSAANIDSDILGNSLLGFSQ